MRVSTVEREPEVLYLALGLVSGGLGNCIKFSEL